jgi:signal transduction histidine kinase
VKNISIKLKLLILSTVSLTILSAILGMVSINKIENTLVEQEYKRLTAARDSKIKQLESIFALYKKQINLLKDTSYVKDLSIQFGQIYETIGADPYEKFPIDNAQVQKALSKWDAFYKRYTDTYPFDDVLIISQKQGHVVYSYGKQNDFGANLMYGEFRNSNLARLWKKVKQYKRTVFIDMEQYAPRQDEPAMFIGTPVYINSKFESILVFKIETKNIHDIMQFRSGYGKTQEDYLVGQDMLMRSDSFLNTQTHSLSNSFKYPQSGKVTTQASQEALKGLSKTQRIINYNNHEVLSSYTPFNIDEALTWAMVSEIDIEEVLKNPKELRNTLFVIACITFLLVMFLLYFVIKRYIIQSLDDFQDGLLDFFKYLNRESDDVKLLDGSSTDEIGIMSKAVNKGIQKTKENILKNDLEIWIKDGVNELNQILINLKSLKQVSDESIHYICNYVHAGVGVFYIFDEKEELLSQYASYAHVVRDELSSTFKPGEGVVGQVALQKKPILLKNIKKDEGLITTGTTTQNAYATYTFPLIYNDVLYGVIELGSFEGFKEETLEFLEVVNKAICIAISTAIQNNKVQELLENTKRANEELEVNQLKLQEANANMEEQQQQLEEANANMEEQQQQLKISEQNLKLQNQTLEETKKDIQKKADELSQAGKYKSEFLANMSHELRTPLNSIILLSSLLQKNSKQTLNDEDIKKAKTIFDSGNDLLRLINDILDLSKVESGKMEVIVDQFKAIDLLNQIKDTFDFTAEEKGVKFNIIDQYNGVIFSDKDRISQIIRNLVSNAFKFTKEGSVTLKIAHSKDINQSFQISVTDTGIGIMPDKQELIFKAFTQAEGGTSRKFGGTGLGLSISKELSQLLGGYIRVSSKQNEGSTFSIDLPNLKQENKDPIEKTSSVINSEPIHTVHESTKTPQDDREILTQDQEAYLIIDDDETFADIVYDEIKKKWQYGIGRL